MSALASAQTLLYTLLLGGAFVFEVVALIESLRYRDEVYRAADKRTKRFWTLLLGGAVLLGFLALPPMRLMPMFLALLGFVAAAVFFTDVRPALRSVDPRYRGR